MPNRGPSGEHTLKVREEALVRVTNLKVRNRYRNMADLIADMCDLFEGKELPAAKTMREELSEDLQQVIDWWKHPRDRDEEALRNYVRGVLSRRK